MSQAPDERAIHTSPLLVGKLLAGKATDDEVRAAEAHARTCSRCGEELGAARQAARRFTESVFPRTLPQLEARRAARRPWATWRLVLPLAAATAAAAVVMIVHRPATELAAFHVKGAGALQVFAKRQAADGAESFAVHDGTVLRPGDAIRFRIVPGDARFVLVASVDGRGRASVYQPSTRVDARETPTVVLPDSIVLDDAPGPERIFALFSDRPIDEAEVTAALAALGARGADAIRGTPRLPLTLPQGQASLCFEKAAPPP